MRRTISGAFAVAALVAMASGAIALPAGAQEAAAKKGAAAAHKHHSLAATAETVQWGWFDVNEKPKLRVDSGDTVSVETWYHALDKIKPTAEDHTLKGPDMDELASLRKQNDGGGPHSITGPIFVNGAEPGDTLEIRILKIVPKEYGQNFNLPGKDFSTGSLSKEFLDGFVRYYKLDMAANRTEFKPGVTLDLKPFPGILAAGVDPNEPKEKAGPPIKDDKGRTSTLRPWKNGSNMDLNELQAGATLYLQVFQKGGLIWIGDAHCRQGNGEVNLEALECAYKEIEIQPIVRKNLKTDWPWAENKNAWIFMGFDEDLTEAMKIAVRNTIEFLSTQKMAPMDRYEAYALASMTADCRVTQMVDIRKGVHCEVPKAIFASQKAPTHAAAAKKE